MKALPFTAEALEELLSAYPTPFYVYDERGIRASARTLIDAFSWNKGFKEYFAVKALPNPAILAILKEEGCGADASSLPELMLADKAGIRGDEIMFTSNDTPAEEFSAAKARGAILNLDAVEHLPYLERAAGLPEVISFRYNPGPAQSGNAIIGNPAEAKFGVTRDQLFEGYATAREKGVARFGLHTMAISNELRAEHFIAATENLFRVARDVEDSLGIAFEFINLGGGLGIPYRPEDTPFDVAAFSAGVRDAYKKILRPRGGTEVKLFMECGRFVTGPHGYLVTKVRHVKRSYKNYAGLDASMANLMRPGMYGAYHHITVLGKENANADTRYDVVGSLCENNDKFAIDRMLPALASGDTLAIHDAGAHAHAMGFNYNGKLRSAEFLMKTDGSFAMVRRAETPDDYFATLSFGS